MTILRYHLDDRHATWLELFFDLVFVASIGVLTHHLTHVHDGHIVIKQLVLFAVEFITVWWIWATHTLYCNRFDTDSKAHRVASLGIMLLMVSMSVFLGETEDGLSVQFVSFYVAIRVLLAGMYISSTGKLSGASDCVRTIGGSIIFGAIVSALSLLLASPFRQILFLGAIVFEMIVSTQISKNHPHAPIHAEHLVERVGLLSIILLGESVISLVAGLRSIALTQYSGAAALTGFVLIGAIWWIYFDSFNKIAQAKRLGQGFILLYSHVAFAIGLGLLSSVIRHSILSDIEMSDFRVIAVSGMVLFYLGKQAIYYSIFPPFRINIFLNTLVCVLITIGSTFFSRLEYALAGMTFGLLFYVYSNFRWTLTKDFSEFLVEN